MKTTIKTLLSVISLIAVLTNSAMASEGDADFVSKALATPVSSVHQVSNPVLGADLEADAFTYNSDNHTHAIIHKISTISTNNIPANTVYGDPLYYSTNQ